MKWNTILVDENAFGISEVIISLGLLSKLKIELNTFNQKIAQ